MTLQQIRGKEGVRVRTAYGRMSKATGVPWHGRNYKTDDWYDADPINRALSTANSYLYAVCQAAIQSVGYSTALGFIHTGKPLSFVYDVADLYKAETTIPAAFEAIAESESAEGKSVREKCREKFTEYKLMRRLVKDIDTILGFGEDELEVPVVSYLWDDQVDWVEGGQDWQEDTQDKSKNPGAGTEERAEVNDAQANQEETS